MNSFPLENREELKAYLEFLLRQYRLVDALWFLNVERRFGTETAEKINEEIWVKIGELAAREIKERFQIGKGLEEFARAFMLYPWSILISHEIEKGEDKLIIKTPHCPPQEARKKQGLGEFACKSMHVRELTNFARVIDENIEVVCLYAPPDEHPPDVWCEWEIKLNTRE
jgi:hypothetical protein